MGLKQTPHHVMVPSGTPESFDIYKGNKDPM
jgi:hypothetical protein